MIRQLLPANGYATIAAVAHHAVHWVAIAMFWWTDRYADVTVPNYDRLLGPSYWVVRVVDQLATLGVFTFLFVSGCFVAIAAGRTQRTVSWRLVGNRVIYLLIPYCVWTGIALLLHRVQGQEFSTSYVAIALLTGKAAAPFYYVPLLIQCYLLSPFLVPLARTHWKGLLAICTVIQLPALFYAYSHLLAGDTSVAQWMPSLFGAWHLPAYLLWFALGIIVFAHPVESRQLLGRYRHLLAAGFIIVFLIAMGECEILRRLSGREIVAAQVTVSTRVLAVLAVLCVVAYGDLDIPLRKQVAYIGTKSYGVYLVHIFVLEIVARATYHFAPVLLAFPVAFLVVLVTLGVAVPLAMMRVSEWALPVRLHRYVFG